MATVLLLGDSIRLSYQRHVGAVLEDVRVGGPKRNCRSSRFLRENLDTLAMNKLTAPTVVHINAGAHDLRRRPMTGGRVLVTLEEYARNLSTIVAQLRTSEWVAEVGMATTTPVDDARHAATHVPIRRNADVEAYNEVLTSVASQLGAPVNDLYRVATAAPVDVVGEDGIHLTTDGATLLGEAVAQFLRPLVAAASALRPAPPADR